MQNHQALSANILIVGAGAMGIITGFILDRAGASVTFLIRPNRKEGLSRPQVLYCYDDVSLKHFAGYGVITSPAEIARDAYDFVILTIDGTALRSPEGELLVRAIGDAARGTKTKVLIGTIGINLRPGFLRLSCLAQDQVFNGGLYILVYQADRVSLPVHPPTDPELLARANFAYRHAAEAGIFVDDSALLAANRFAEIWNASGMTRCVVLGEQEYSARVPAVFPMFAACDIMGWPSAAVLATDPELWELAAQAVREVQGLGVNGEAGKKAQEVTTAEGLLQMCRQLEEETWPLDLWAFNRFHHGGKVFEQDVQLLEDCVALGEAEGQPMSALKELIGRVRAARGHGDGDVGTRSSVGWTERSDVQC